MIESRYGLKYSMPHSLVHIVDNSQYSGPLPVAIAEDPSLLATLVVTGAPMGEDNKMITMTRADIPGIAYGMNSLSVEDIKKYGQGVTYAQSLINQGVPVRFMRVTPEGSTYAVSSLVVQWRIDGSDNKLHVRFKLKAWPESLQRDKFKNTARLNEALVKNFKVNDADKDGDGVWKQRAFINFISAGRGSAYNYMANAINLTTQAKRPKNVRYEFVTIDTRTNAVVERFFASLANVGNGESRDAVESVNTLISKREEGSSIVVPYVNDAAVRELYNVYMNHYKEMLETAEPDEFTSNAYKAMNINIFDMIFGNYIYNGTDTATKMPFYQVDMIDTDVPELSIEKRLSAINDIVKDKSLWDKSNPVTLYNKLLSSTYGVSRRGDSVYLGDIYLTPSGNGNANPKINIVTAINQYTGNVTSMTIPRVYPLNYEAFTDESGAHPAWTCLYKTTSGPRKSKPISILVNDVANGQTDSATSAQVDKMVGSGALTTGAIIASYTDPNSYDAGFDLYTLEVVTNAIGTYTILHYMNPKYYYEMLDRDSHSGGTSGTGNAMGFWYTKDTDSAWNRVGATVVVRDASGENKIYVNSYQRTSADDDSDVDDSDTRNRIPVTYAATRGKIGTVPTSVNLTEDLMGSQFDVQVYKNDFIDKWKITNLSVASGGAGYKVGDRLVIKVLDSDTFTEVSQIQQAYDHWITTDPDSVYQFTALTTEPADWSTNYNGYYAKKNGQFVVITGTTVPTFETGKFYTCETEEERYQRFEDDVWTNYDTATKNQYTDTWNTDACHTIIQVDSVDESGAVTGFHITQNNEYDSSGSAAGNVSPRQVLVTDEGVEKTIPTVLIPSATGPARTVTEAKFVMTGFKVTQEGSSPVEINRFAITGSLGSIFRVQLNPVSVPANYYSSSYGINPTSELLQIKLSGGSTGFFDDENINDIVYKYKYSARLVEAFRGDIDPRIQSPTRCPAKYLFDAGYNTIVGTTILPYLHYTATDVINASIIFTDDEKEELLYNPEIIDGLRYADIDVKQAMYDLMIYRCYHGIPEDKRPVGYGSGLSLHLDSGLADANTIQIMATSFAKRFDNANASWDFGGWNDVETGLSFTYLKQMVDNMFRHIKATSVNKPYTKYYTTITKDRYTSYFPDVDTTDWELRELLYKSGGNAWIAGPDGGIERRSQRTLARNVETSDLVQESNMRTLSQLVYLLQGKIDNYLLDYNDDAVIKTLSDEVNNMFSNWVGNLIDRLDITFARDINIDGGEILVCNVNAVFRGLILRVPIIVNINRRDQ